MVTDIDCMKLAITEARECRGHSDTDPLVGAVLAKSGELIGKAHRSQKEPGDHAEFTLLQKVLRSRDIVAGATLYTTLEPCTSRSHDKKPCADWIISKNISRVVVGLLDPNPSICGRGYWRLIEAGIAVDFFPSELVEEIKDMNSSFVASHRGPLIMKPAFSEKVQHMKSSQISPYPAIGWGDALSMQDCPFLREGWPLDSVRLVLKDSEEFQMPVIHKSSYEDYIHREWDNKRFVDDRVKYMLSLNPTAFSDSPSLILELKRTKYSEMEYYRDNVASLASTRNTLIEDLVRGSRLPKFPHSLCMHLVVVTTDSQILLTKRSPKVAYFPSTWSASVEEQLATEDLDKRTGEASALHWGQRLLCEELGLDQDQYHSDNLRLLSVFLESDYLNVSLCAIVELRIDYSHLDSVISGQPRTDYEFSEWAFTPLDRRQLLSELIYPKRSYHPTTGYRLLYTFLKYFGSPSDDEFLGIKGAS